MLIDVRDKPEDEDNTEECTSDGQDGTEVPGGSLWPGGEAAAVSLADWRAEECILQPAPPREGNRPRQGKHQVAFGLVNRPIVANSEEWKSPNGQEAMMNEVKKHEDKKTWDISKVRELGHLLEACRDQNKEIVLGGTPSHVPEACRRGE